VVVDKYGDFVVVQWLSAGALPWREELPRLLRGEFTTRSACGHWPARDRRSPRFGCRGRRRHWKSWSRKRVAVSRST
jgi:23S rRNA G2069 N7-methylase RlmK/C1962 C5-methylase RlmI